MKELEESRFHSADTDSREVSLFQEQMIMAWEYISRQISHRDIFREHKAKGGYDGRHPSSPSFFPRERE